MGAFIGSLMECTLRMRSKIIISSYKEWFTGTDKVLDVGCGNSVVSDEIRKFFNCKIVGTDILDYRKKNIPFVIMPDAKTLPFKDNEFGICMFNDVLHHIDNNTKKAIIAEALRVARGVLIFEMQPTSMAKFLDIFINIIHNPTMSVPLAILSDKMWPEYFHNLNYKYKKVKKNCFFYPFDNFVFYLTRK